MEGIEDMSLALAVDPSHSSIDFRFRAYVQVSNFADDVWQVSRSSRLNVLQPTRLIHLHSTVLKSLGSLSDSLSGYKHGFTVAKFIPFILQLCLSIRVALSDKPPPSRSPRSLQILRHTSHRLPFDALLSRLISPLGNSHIRAA